MLSQKLNTREDFDLKRGPSTLRCAALALLGLVAGCSNGDEIARESAQIESFGPPINFDLGDLVRVEGLLSSDNDGNFALFFRSGAGDYSGWDCVVLRDIPWLQELLLPSRQSDDLQARSFETTGQIVEVNVTFGRGDGVQHGPRHCLMAIDVESIQHLEISDQLADKLALPVYALANEARHREQNKISEQAANPR